MPKVMIAAKVDVKNGFNALVDSSDSEGEMPAKRKTSRQVAPAPLPINAWMDTAKREELAKSLLNALRAPKSVATPCVSSKMDDKMIPVFRFKGTNGKSWADYDTDDDE
jgi:hypothetical protein